VSPCRSGRYGCSACAELVIIVSNSASSASLWSSVTDGRSVAQKPILLQRLRNRSRRSRSAAEQMPVQAGAQYMIFGASFLSVCQPLLQFFLPIPVTTVVSVSIPFVVFSFSSVKPHYCSVSVWLVG